MISATMNQTAEQVWTETQALLRPQMTQATYETILQQTRLLSLTNGTYRVQAETEMGQEWLEHRLKETVVRALTNVVGHSVEVEFVVAKGAANGSGSSCPSVTPPELPLLEPQPPVSPCAVFARGGRFSKPLV